MMWFALALAAAGLLLSALFNGAETGFYRAVRLRLILSALGGDVVARALLALSNRPALFVATVLVGGGLANYLLSLAMVMAADGLFPRHPHAAEVVAPIVFAPWVLLYGELLPKNLFLHAPNRLLRRTGPLLLVFVVLLLPVSVVLWALSRALARLVGGTVEPARLILARRELRRILADAQEAGVLHLVQRDLSRGLFTVGGQPISRFILPARSLPRATAASSKAEVLELAALHRTAVVPIADPRRDRLLGYVRVIDLRLSDAAEVGPLRPLLEFASDSPHLACLMQLESAGESLGQVVDAAGKPLGLVSLDTLRAPLLARAK
jgi:putative hemolysin